MEQKKQIGNFWDSKMERKARKTANDALYAMCANRYHDSIPLNWLDGILKQNGFSETESAIYCGRDGSSNEQVGNHTWLALQWHKMESGRYEINAYLS
jgi:hypothetical protein